MSGTGEKPNNELYELNALLSGVEASEESLDDILAEIYGKKSGQKPEDPETPAPEETPTVEPPPPEAPAEESEDETPSPGLVSPTPWRTDPPPEVETPPVVRDDDEEQPDVLSDPKPKKQGRSKLVVFPGADVPDEPDAPPEPPSPSAWVEPKEDELPPIVVEGVFPDPEPARPDGYTPGKKARDRKTRKSVQDRRETYRAAPAEPVEEPAEGQKGGRFARWRAQADAFADNMFSQAPRSDEDTEMAEKYIPGTDEEAAPVKPKKERRPQKERPPEEDIHPRELSHIFFTGLNFMNRRVIILLALTLITAYLAIAAGNSLPLPDILRSQPTVLAGVQLWLLGWCIVFSLDVIWMGIACLADGLLTLHTVADFAVLFTVADAVQFCAVGREGPMPYCAPACLILLCLTWGAYDRKLGNYRATRQAALTQEPHRITKDEQLWNARDTFTKERGDAQDFGAQIQAPSGADLIQTRFAPVILLAAFLLSFLASVARGRPGSFLWCLSTILVATSPLSAVLCYSQPWLRLTRRLEKCGAAVAGWPGVKASAGNAGILISDTDLFPTGSVQFNGIKVYGDIPLEKLAGCAASLIRTSGSGLADLFDGLVRTQGGFYRRVDNFQCYEAGGLSGDIRGEHIMVGSASFMAVMDIPLPQDLKVKNAVFCAIDGSLRGIFALNYAKTNSVRPAILSLLQTRLIPVLVPRDFNITPAMVRQKMKLPVEKMEYPPVERRMELTETEQDHALILNAILSRDSVESYAETIVGCRRLRSCARTSAWLSIAASLVGLVLGFYLVTMQAYSSLSAINVLAFLALWLIPNLMVSGNVNRY